MDVMLWIEPTWKTNTKSLRGHLLIEHALGKKRSDSSHPRNPFNRSLKTSIKAVHQGTTSARHKVKTCFDLIMGGWTEQYHIAESQSLKLFNFQAVGKATDTVQLEITCPVIA